MKGALEEFKYRRSLVSRLNYEEARDRLSGFYKWLGSDPATQKIINKLTDTVDMESLIKETGTGIPPKASTPEEIAAIGIFFLEKCCAGEDPVDFSDTYGIRPSFTTSSIQDSLNEVVNRYIDPAFDYIERELELQQADRLRLPFNASRPAGLTDFPLEITESLKKFFQDHPDFQRNAFIMMRFHTTRLHTSIIEAIRNTLDKYGISALRSDDKEYHDDLFGNVLTYLHGCSFGIAVFERLEADDFNPNVSLEVGYMRALRKSVCLLKDKTLKTLQSDLVGKLYKAFDPQDPEGSIPSELERWLRDKDIITI
jgi:hypothetical protein